MEVRKEGQRVGGTEGGKGGREEGREGGGEERKKERLEREKMKGRRTPAGTLPLSPLIYHPIGPFRYLDSYGAQKLLSTINRFRETYGDHFEPAPLLQDFAKDPSRKFHPK